MANTSGFMETPLVVWVSTFHTETVSYKDVCDGLFLNGVMKQIDPRCISDGLSRNTNDVRERLNNWDILMKNIKSYYQDVLQQFIVMRLPNILTVCRTPNSDNTQEELRKVLLLILGCAVQCERKEQFIENIKMLDITTQHGIVEFIKEITDDTKNVFAIDIPLDNLDETSRSMHFHLRMLIQERDSYIEEIKELSYSADDLDKVSQKLQALQLKNLQLQSSPTTSPEKQEKQHLSLEVAELKSRMRKLRQEVEEKTEYNVELQEELEEYKAETQKLRSENLELTQDARAVRTYRDEIDILKEKASRVDKFEVEVTKYKEKLNELDFFKTRVDELRDDNQVLVEQRNVLEEQIDLCRKRNETVVDMETEMMRFKQHSQELTHQLNLEREKIAELTEINTRLEFDKKGSLAESANLEEELVNARLNKPGLSNSLSDQLNETVNAKLLRLDLENKRLRKKLEEQKERTIIDNSSKFLEVQKENLRLAKRVETFQEVKSKDTQDVIVLEQINLDLKHNVESLEETIETVKESGDRQVKELERENSQLQGTIQTLRERNEKTHDVRLKEIERDNKRLTENVKILTSQISTTEYEKRQIQKSYEHLKESTEQLQELEEENTCVEKENEELRKNLTTLELRCDKYEKVEQECLDIEVENQKLNKMVDSLQKSAVHTETIEQENINLTVELQHLKRNFEVAKNSSVRVANLEHEKDMLNREIQQLKRTIGNSKSDKDKQEQLEIDLLDLDTDNQKMQRQVEGYVRKIQDVETENNDLLNQVEKYQKAMENMKGSLKKLDDIERDNKDLEQENVRIHKDKSQLEKENKKLKHSIESKDSTVDELTAKLSTLQRENKRVTRMAEIREDTDSHVQELERENHEILQQSSMDKRTLSALREDLVTEKIKTQQMSNELQKITQELEKVGLNKDKLIAAEQAQDESKYKALESLLEETVTNTMTIKEEKIVALESRLEESKSRNIKLQTELQTVKRDHEALQQRREEEVLLASAPSSDRERSSPRGQGSHSTKLIMPQPNSTKQILELKDHIISVERKNATLEAEARNFTSQTTDLRSQLSDLQKDHARAQNMLTSVQTQYNTLQSQCANVQVENRTLQSQTASLLSQNASLQKHLTDVENEHEQLLRNHEEVQSAQESLQSDHDSLEKLHEQLSTEYEALITEHGTLKTNHKILRNEVKELQDQNMILVREKETITDLKHTLEQDKEDLKLETRSRGALQFEYVRLKEDMMKLQNSKDRLDREHRDLLAEHKSMKSEYNQLKTKHSDLKMSFDDYTKQLNAMDIEVAKLANKCESLAQLNSKLEDENRNLMMQMQALLNQNQDLLTTALESKDQMHEKQQANLEQMANLRRQKEKLEEKIMEQYKRYDPVKKKNRGFSLFRKAKALVGTNKDKKDKSRSRSLGPAEFSQIIHDGENSSLGSGSQSTEFPQSPTGKRKAKNKKTRGGTSMDESPKLSKQSKALAKSTTALNYMRPQQSYSDGFSVIRGAKSSENLLDGSGKGRNDEWSNPNDHTNNNSEWIIRPGRRTLMSTTSSTTSIAPRNRASFAAGETPGDDEDDGLTLEEFLQECDKSPKSRRKWLIENRVDLDVSKTSKGIEMNEPLSKILSPNLGPRSPTIENGSKSGLSKRSKSEMNISKLSSYSLSPMPDTDRGRDKKPDSFTSPSPSSRQQTPDRDTWTSTPKNKYNTIGSMKSHSVRETAPQGYGQRAQQPQPQQPVGPTRNLPQTPQINNCRLTVNGDYGTESPLRSRSAIGFMSHDEPRVQDRDGSDNSAMRRQNSGSSAGSGSIGSYNARQGTAGSAFSPPQNNGPTNMINSSHNMRVNQAASHQRYPSTDSSGDRPVNERTMPPNTYTGAHSGPPRTPVSSRHAGLQPMKASYIPPEHQNNQDQYNPGNVRHLVQNFQKNVQQTQQHQQHPQSPAASQKSFNTSHSSNQSPSTHPIHSPPMATSSPYQSQPAGGYSPNKSSQSQYSPPQLTQPQKYNPGNQYPTMPNQSNHTRTHESEPVAPPRRPRPLSAGPLKSSTGSAFSPPANRSHSPPPFASPPNSSYERMDSSYRGKSVSPQYNEGLNRGASARSLPARPDERLQPQGQAAPPPPPKGPPSSPRDAPQGQTPDDPPVKGKKPVWYEYGCV